MKIRKTSRILKTIFFAAACALPLLVAGFWITDGYYFCKNWMPDYSFFSVGFGFSESRVPLIKPLAELDTICKFLGFLAMMIPASLEMAVLFLLSKLFKTFESLEFFSKRTVALLKKIGIFLLLNQLIYSFYTALMTFVLTFKNAPGSRCIAVYVTKEQLQLAVVAIIIILISWIMDEGRKLKEEQEATV